MRQRNGSLAEKTGHFRILISIYRFVHSFKRIYMIILNGMCRTYDNSFLWFSESNRLHKVSIEYIQNISWLALGVDLLVLNKFYEPISNISGNRAIQSY